MVDLWLPYGKTEVCARIPTRNFLGVIQPNEKSPAPDPRTEMERALNNPIGTEPLNQMVKPSNTVAIVVDDVTRATPTHLILPPLINQLNKAGVQAENITIIFANGSHRPVTPAEMKGLIGEQILNEIKTINHDSKNSDLVFLGRTRTFGTNVYVNRVFAEADVKILTGDIGLHYYAGYGGGRKSVLPGISGAETIQRNHSNLLHPKARTGILEENPVHQDMVEAAKLAKADFILNVVTNSKQEIVQAFAGDMEQAFNEGVKTVDEMYKVSIEQRADIVVVSSGGYPLDMNLYQAYKGVDNALHAAKRNGVIVLVAECQEGHGNEVFYDWMVKFKTLKEMEKAIKKRFMLGGHKSYYLLKALQRVKIILVSVMPDYQAVNIFNLKTAPAVNDALRDALDISGKNARIWAIPHGNYTLPIMKTT